MASDIPLKMSMNNKPSPARSVQRPGNEQLSMADQRPTIIGIYGVPGCGKSYLLEKLKAELGEDDFAFYEGSQQTHQTIPGGLAEFKSTDEGMKKHFRERAIVELQAECLATGKIGVVTGHLLFYTEGHNAEPHVFTLMDGRAYTHILYLDTEAHVTALQTANDRTRTRICASVSHIRHWQQTERTKLRQLCREHGIYFMSVGRDEPQRIIATLLRDIQKHSEAHNDQLACRKLDEVLSNSNSTLDTVLVLDADRTLAPIDASEVFWQEPWLRLSSDHAASPLRALFGGPWGHSYKSFRQAMLYYEEVANDEQFERLTQAVASKIRMYPEVAKLLDQLKSHKHVTAMVFTSGLRQVWQKVLNNAGFQQTVNVIGGSRLSDGFVVTANVKTKLVDRLRDHHKKYVWAIGDSHLDLGMLGAAHQAFVIVGEEDERSKSMEAHLAQAIDEGLSVRQILLPDYVTPRLDTSRLPVAQLSDQALVDSLLRGRSGHARLELHLANGKAAAKLLSTNMRDAAVAGPSLRTAHRLAGLYLAIEYLTEIIGLENKPIKHVLGQREHGSQLLDENKTVILAMMRGGDPLGLGISEVFPKASYIHAKQPEDVQFRHIKGQRTIFIVDSVINTGQSIVEMVQRVRSLHATIRIVIVAGVVQNQAVVESNPDSLHNRLADYTGITLVGLRTSTTKFKGSGATDTGNRLFNTTHLE